MSKQIKYLIVFGSIILVLAGAITALVLTAPEKKDNTTSESVGITVQSKEADTVQKVELTNEHGEIVMNRTGTEKWEIPALKGLPVTEDTLSYLATDVSTITAISKIENPKDAKEYGLSPAKATAKVTYTDKTQAVFEVGNVVPGDKGYYFRVQGQEDIYIVSDALGSTYLAKPGYFINTVLISASIMPTDQQNAIDSSINLAQMTLGGTLRKTPLELKKRENKENYQVGIYAYFLVDQGSWLPANTQTITEVFQSLSSVIANDVAAIRPTDEQLKSFGLKNPVSTCRFVSGNQTYTLKLGALKDGQYYAMANDIDVVYMVDEAAVPWAQMQGADILSKNLLLTNIVGLKAVTVKTDDGTYRFEITIKDEDVYSVKLKGKELNIENFKTYYQVLVSAQGEEPATEKPSGKPNLTITYEYLKGGKDVVAFTPNGARRSYATVNGKGYFNVRDTLVDKIVADTQKVIVDKTVETAY